MIGGNDIVFPATGLPSALDACAQIVQRHWPHARYENAETGQKYAEFSGIPFGRVRQLLAYPDADAEAMWDADRSDSPVNSMMYLILAANSVTVVVDEPSAGEMPAILDEIKIAMEMNLLNAGAICSTVSAP